MTLEASLSGHRYDFEETGGTCVTSFGEADPVIDGDFDSLDPLPTDPCAVAVGTGFANMAFQSDSGGWSAPSPLNVTGAKAADAVTLVFTSPGLELVATAVLVQTPSSTDVCSGGSDPVTWTGALVWEDPVLDE